ncbi:MAG: DOPA 4,5-dioxygenase family protein [Alphaproteobacteria bacterium]|nr:DOPA 4,5-dioxygenase family protein [Alphaproteobacteria bacterium]
MSINEIDSITGYHAHVYYDADTKAPAATLREAIDAAFSDRVVLGRWHDEPVGPHPIGSYQVAFEPEVFADLVPWLALNREGLTVFLHPDTGDSVPDHVDHALWLGEKYEIDVEKLK